jgi:hypothetical protein
VTVQPTPTRSPSPTAIGTASPSPTGTATTEPPPTCGGDCDGSGGVAVNELVLGVNIALERAAVAACPAFDQNDSQRVEVDELVDAVNNSLKGCDA